MKYKACSGIGLALVLVVTGVSAAAQNGGTTQSASSGQSLGDYARQVKKEPGAKSMPKVFDNDNLPRQDKLSVIGQAPQPAQSEAASENKPADAAAGEAKPGTEAKPAETKAATEEKAPTAAKPPVEDEATKQAAAKQWADKIDSQKNQIDLLSRELDVLQREYQIRAAAMYADAGNRLRNQGDWDKQDAQYKQQIADKQKSVEDARQKLDDLQEQARKAGSAASSQQQQQTPQPAAQQ